MDFVTEAQNKHYKYLKESLLIKHFRAGGYSGAPVTEGSRPSIFLVTSDEVANVNGAYYDSKCKRVKNLFKDSTNVEYQEKLWKMTEDICKEHGVNLPAF